MATNQNQQLHESHFSCLRLVAEGKPSKVIAKELGLSPNTVDTYLREAMRYFGVGTRLQAALRYLSAPDVPHPPNLIPQPRALPPASDPAMLQVPYEMPLDHGSSEVVHDVVVDLGPEWATPAASPQPGGASDERASPLDVLVKILAVTTAMVVVLSAAEPLGKGFERLARFILQLHHM